MMLKVAKLGIAIAAVLAWIVPAAYAGVPDVSKSYYVPQRGAVGTSAVEGTSAVAFFRACPNNDGGTSLPQNARVKIVVIDSNNNPIAGIGASDVCVLFNGGTPAQGFSGVGADSVIANSQYNFATATTPLCPDVRCLQADDQTNAAGETYITFTGSTPGSPGIGTRNPARKWGHYDSELPVYVLGFKLSGRLTSGDTNGSYILRIKNYDHTNIGLGTVANVGEQVTSSDFGAVRATLGVNNATSYWRDFDSNGAVGSSDYSQIRLHVTHDCDTPLP